jgi:hypothetical protein
MRKRALLSALSVLLVAACQNAAERTPPHTLLWLPSNVKPFDGAASFKDGSAVVSFNVDNVEPDLLTHQLIEHYSNTRRALRTRADREWIIFPGGGIIQTDVQGRPIKLQTRYWRAEWEDDGGNLIKYTLKDSRIADSHDNTVSVYGRYVPASLVRRDAVQ